ncbi:hypothetical protein BDSB_17785 [Burkholderia dolosa PC543]|nr:hypothetical protein BDSB_17785 [Burkholderia dolosa PC543]
MPICRLPIVEFTAPETPSTVGFGEFVLIVTVAVPLGAAPVDQLLPTVQSLLVVPCHTCAVAGDDQQPIASAPMPTLTTSAWHRPLSAPLLLRRVVSSDATTQVPSAFDQIMRNM